MPPPSGKAINKDNEEAEEFQVEEPVPMSPLIYLLQLRHTYTSQYVNESKREEAKAAILKEAYDNNMSPYLRFICESLGWPLDEAKMQEMDATNAKKLEELDARIKDAQENLGDVEVREALLAKCEHFARIGDLQECLKVNMECSGKTLAAGPKLDLCFQRILFGIAFSDNEIAANGIRDAHRLMKEGDWERRNRLKVYEGIYHVFIRDFKRGSELLLDCISTFAASELMDFNEFILITVVASLTVLSRSELKQQIVDSPEVLSANIKDVFHLITVIYNCRYKEVFPALDTVCQHLRSIVYLSQHVNYFFREVRVLVFTQFLDSYSSVTLNSMSATFGIPPLVLDSMLGTLISNERIACKMDRVSDSITTYRGDTTNFDYHRIVKNGDLLLNRIQKLSRLAEIMSAGALKRRATPSAIRKKKAKQRIRKKIQRKLEKKRPNWKAAIAKTYFDPKAAGKKPKPFGGKSRKRARDDDDNDDDASADGATSIPDDGEVQSDVDEEKQERMNQRDPLETQLFLRRLPLDTSEEELARFFESRFGQVRRVLLVRNRATRVLAGTGFVHCGTAALAEKIFAHAQQNARELAAVDRADWREKTANVSHCQAKRMRFKLRADAFVTRDPFLTIRDTRFTVHRVMSRTDSQEALASLVKKQKRTKVAADDPRHLYLLREGLILPDTPAARGLPPQYLTMIAQDYEARKSQLRDSNMFVSNTRLNVRNLPRTMTEKELRTIFSTHVRSFLKENKNYMDKDKWGKYGPIKNIKLVKDSAGASKGYAFIEFVNHPIALHALRAINNNPTIFGDHRRLMVSFAIEDINAIQKLQRMREIRRERQTQNGGKKNEE